MSDMPRGDEAPEPVQPSAAQPAAEQQTGWPDPEAMVYAPPPYGPPTAMTAVGAAPKKKVSERVFGWRSLVAAASVGLVIGGGVAAGVAAVVFDGAPDQGQRELGQRGGGQPPYGQMPDGGRMPDDGQMPDFGQRGGPGGFGEQQEQSDGQPSQGQPS